MNKIVTGIFICFLISLMACQTEQLKSEFVEISKEVLKDKIKGGWAAQTIGVTFGSPVEFKYNGTMIQDYQKIPWSAKSMPDTYENEPGFYDDIYMDLTFVQVLEDEGLDAPAISFAKAFANAEYKLWFANQQARYNVLNGLEPPQTGHWLNNPCADDIDFQIEADFAGLMSPGMVNTCSEICDKIGHIMNYGDGWYGGVYVGAMYSLAFVSDDIVYVVEEALKTIPAQSKFYHCISDVIKYYKEDPVDWKNTWFRVHRKWSEDIGSPIGVYAPFNIDAKINAAWVVMGLLYGNGDYTRTFEISARCGDDADCNPATAGGILATIKGYKSIPDFWRQGLAEVEPIDFKYTTISLNEVYDLSYKHALELIKKNGGEITEDKVKIKVQKVETVPLEIAFEGHHPKEKISLNENVDKELSFEFEGIGFALTGGASKLGKDDYVFEVEMYVDNELIETAKLPTDFTTRRFYPFYRYQLPNTNHKVLLKILNPTDEAVINIGDVLVYDDKPFKVKY